MSWGARSHAAAILTLIAAGLAQPALATVPGANGEIAYVNHGAGDTDPSRGIYVGNRQVTTPRPSQGGGDPEESDYDPAWSPDGERIAFHRSGEPGPDGIWIVGKDGIDPTLFFDPNHLHPPPSANGATEPTWSPDGQWIAFRGVVGNDPSRSGIWAIRADGDLTSLRLFVADRTATAPDWSAANEIVYRCSFRNTPAGFPLTDLCVKKWPTGPSRQLPVDVAGGTRADQLNNPGSNYAGAKWTPDGRLVFPVAYIGSGDTVQRSEVFMMNADGTQLQQITNSPVHCPSSASGRFAQIQITGVAPSPDGELIAATTLQYAFDDDGVCRSDGVYRISTLDVDGGVGGVGSLSHRVESPYWLRLLAWQPIPADLVVRVNDGHGNALEGLKLELFDATPAHGVVPGRFENKVGGSYAFLPDTALAPGDYVVRATLVDVTPNPDQNPFDIRVSALLPPPQPPENTQPSDSWAPVWLEQRITVEAPPQKTIVDFPFDHSNLLASNIPSEHIADQHLDDLAFLYFRVHQYVEWLKSVGLAELGTGPTVHFYTFVATDNNRPSDDCCTVKPRDAYYQHVFDQIVMGVEESTFEARDGLASASVPPKLDFGPENSEWHEFTHHLYDGNVAVPPCLDDTGQVQRNHGGYSNYSSCDSMQEGFAAFLPTLAARSIDAVSDSFYDGLADVDWHTKAWGTRTGSDGAEYSAEDLAVAALFWDLVDDHPDTELSSVIRPDGSHTPVAYRDDFSIPLSDLWSQLTPFSGAGQTVAALRASFGDPPETIDLDGDGIFDIAPVDVPFLMHGFFPLDRDEQATSDHAHHYRVADPVGLSDHREYNQFGTIIRTLLSRNRLPESEGANLGISIRDAAGRPISFASIDVAIQYPNRPIPVTSRRQLDGSDGALHLELPSHYDYLLPDGAPLPPCDPANDVQISVELTGTINGYRSTNAPVFDNCSYQHAIAAASGPTALSFTIAFPEDGTAPATTATATATPPAVNNTTTGTFAVDLACADPVVAGFATGCARSEYRIDGGPIIRYEGRALVAGVGQHTFEYRSVDAASNQEGFRSIALEIVDLDSDGDGIGDASESQLGTDPNDPDSDDDGLADGAEVGLGTSPLVADSDGDGLSDGAEVSAGSNPTDADSDDDGVQDGADVCRLVPDPGQENLDGDAQGDACDTDDDDDGLSDDVEISRGTNPLDADSDDDGASDLSDNCPVVANADQRNTDVDPLGDACDADDDNDGLSDDAEIAGGTDPRNGDTDSDGLADPDELTAGTNPLDPDSDDDDMPDGDEVEQGANPLDPDSDDDGLYDGEEVIAGTSPIDADSDDDGVDDATDNCPLIANSGQQDQDRDGTGDACDSGPIASWQLVGVTHDLYATTKESLFALDTSNGSATFLMALGNGGMGEAIAFNPVDGLLYHASGYTNDDLVWETIDLASLSIVTSGPMAGGPGSDVLAATYNPATGRFLLIEDSRSLWDITPTGVATSLGGVVSAYQGLAFASGTLYAAARNDDRLDQVNPATGGWLAELKVTLAGVSVEGLGGLATDPSTGTVWGVINPPGSTQYLASIDLVTGVATSVGVLPDDFAGIAFVPEPSSMPALGAGVVAVALCALHRRRRISLR